MSCTDSYGKEIRSLFAHTAARPPVRSRKSKAIAVQQRPANGTSASGPLRGLLPRGVFADKMAMSRSGHTVLIVEDDDELRDLLVQCLCDDFDIIVATNADEGVAVARMQRPSLVLCDLNMPGKNGLHTIDAIRRDAILANIPIILMSGQQPPAEAARHSVPFLPKPFQCQTLVDAVKTVLERTHPVSTALLFTAALLPLTLFWP